MRWTVVQHEPTEGWGLFGILAAERGHGVDLRAMWQGAAVPAGSEVDALVVLGGSMGALDDGDHPYLPGVRSLMGEVARAGRPVLGICLGAQLLAAALGAGVRRGPALEVGIGSVELTGDGRADPVLGPAGPSLPVLHWHHDTFDLPARTTHLASSAQYPNQGFRLGERAYGLQFHIEIEPGLAAAFTPHLPSGVTLPPDGLAAVERTGRAAFGRLLDVAAH